MFRQTSVLLVCCSLAFGVQAAAPQRAVIRSVTVERPNLVVHGSHLAKVEWFGIPTGTGIGYNGALLGKATRQTPAGGNEVWVLPIPPEGAGPFTNIYAEGFDRRGHKVGEKYLPFAGASNVYDALWGKPGN